MLDPTARSVQQVGVPVAMPAREFDLLRALMLNADRVLSREQPAQPQLKTPASTSISGNKCL